MSTYEDERRIREKLSTLFEAEIKKISDSNETYKSIMRQKANKKLFRIGQSMEIIHNDELVYSPKCDLTVGPNFFEKGEHFTFTAFFNDIMEVREIKNFVKKLKEKNKSLWEFEEDFNKNPRCLIIFEFEKKTKDLKHIIGSIANASFLGKIGVLVVSDEIYTTAKRLLDYIAFCEEAKKIDQLIFRNVIIIKYSDLKRMLSIW